MNQNHNKPKFTDQEIKHRHAQLNKCFKVCDMNNDGMIDNHELEAVAKCFNPGANTEQIQQEVKIILGKLDKNQDSKIDQAEWVTVLFDLFQFMNPDAFDKHCEELLNVVNKGATQVAAQ